MRPSYTALFSLVLAALNLNACRSGLAPETSTVKDDLGETHPEYAAQCAAAAPVQLSLTGTADGADTASLDGEVNTLLVTRCEPCHVADSGHKFEAALAYDALATPVRGLIDPKNPEASLLYQKIKADAMPRKKAGEATAYHLSADEKALVLTWITTHAAATASPSAPAAGVKITPADQFACMAKDIAALRQRDPSMDVGSVRYFSLAHLAPGEAAEQDMATYRAGLTKLVNSLSMSPALIKPVAVDPPFNTLYRIDLRSYGWTASNWDSMAASSPYTVRYSTTFDSVRNVSDLTRTTTPVVRADWFIATASQGETYYTLLNLPETEAEIEKLLGVDAERDLQTQQALRGGLLPGASGIAKQNRVVERHRSSWGSYWKSFDFSGNDDLRDIAKNPLGPCLQSLPVFGSAFTGCQGSKPEDRAKRRAFRQDGGEHIFTLPNGMLGFVIVDADGKRLSAAVKEVVADDTNPDFDDVRAGLSCFRCHASGLNSFQDQLGPLMADPQLFTDEKAKLTAQYLYRTYDRSALANAIEADNHGFAAATAELGIGGMPDDPISSGMHRFVNTRITLDAAAAETYLAPAEFKRRLNVSLESGTTVGSDAKARLTSLKPLLFGQDVPRSVFEAAFPSIVRSFGLGQSFKAAN